MKARRLLAVLERQYSEAENRMQTIRVIYHHEPEGWWAESPDIGGWYAAADSYAELEQLIEEGVPFALGHEAKVEISEATAEHAA